MTTDLMYLKPKENHGIEPGRSQTPQKHIAKIKEVKPTNTIHSSAQDIEFLKLSTEDKRLYINNILNGVGLHSIIALLIFGFGLIFLCNITKDNNTISFKLFIACLIITISFSIFGLIWTSIWYILAKMIIELNMLDEFAIFNKNSLKNRFIGIYSIYFSQIFFISSIGFYCSYIFDDFTRYYI